MLSTVLTPSRSTSLVQTRAFSFSDDASQVALPFNTSTTSPKHTSPQAQVFLQSFDAALAYFKIREIQSEWYMDLFQSGRDPWHDPYPYIWKIYAKMTEWFNNLPASSLPSTKSFFELELLYSYVYILSPSPRIPHIHDYAQRLIFEHCIGYATNLLALISKQSNTTKPPITFYDAMRAYMTGRQFVDVVSRNLDVILDPIPPVTPAPAAPQVASEDPLAPPVQTPPPPFPSPIIPEGLTTPQDPTIRAITAINDFTTILSRFGLRFGFTHWRDRFQRESTTLLQQLYHRSSISPVPSPPTHNINAAPQYPYLFTNSPNSSQPIHHGHPTTPPSIYPPQPSPFASTHMTSPFAPPQDWTTPSPQPPNVLPDMPQPSEGRVRQAMVYGPGLPLSQIKQEGNDIGGSAGWNVNPGQN